MKDFPFLLLQGFLKIWVFGWNHRKKDKNEDKKALVYAIHKIIFHPTAIIRSIRQFIINELPGILYNCKTPVKVLIKQHLRRCLLVLIQTDILSQVVSDRFNVVIFFVPMATRVFAIQMETHFTIGFLYKFSLSNCTILLSLSVKQNLKNL